MTHLRQTKQFARFMDLSGWIVKKAGGAYVFLRKLPLLPPLIMKVSYPKPPISFVQIEKLAQKYHPLKIQIQPLKAEKGLKKYSYRFSREAGHVTKTLQLDLTPSEERMMKQMKKDARYAIRKAKNIKIFRDLEIEKFRRAWKKSVGWQRYIPSLKTILHLKKAFRKKVLLLAASYSNEIIAGTIVLIANKTASYYYAFTSKEGRKKYAQYLLVWEAIKETKKKGCKTFDFEGIYDSRFSNKSWLGFSHFKKSFGGKEVKYPGCWVKHLPWLKTRPRKAIDTRKIRRDS